MILILYVGTRPTKKYLDAKYGYNNMEPVIKKIGKVFYRLEFNILDVDTTYYFFEDEESKAQFLKQKPLDRRSEILLMSPDFHIRKNEKDPKLVIKLKLIDANHCPGSCMFLFWIYEITSDNEINQQELYIYTGDYCLTDAMKSKLLELRNSEEVKKVTVVNDNTRIGKKDYAFKTDDKAIEEMKKFIASHKNDRSALITVKIGADWGMEDLWIRLAREYKTCLYVSNNRYSEILNCMDKYYHQPACM